MRLAAWKPHNRGMTSFNVSVYVDHSIQNFTAGAEFAVKSGVAQGHTEQPGETREMEGSPTRTNFGISLS